MFETLQIAIMIIAYPACILIGYLFGLQKPKWKNPFKKEKPETRKYFNFKKREAKLNRRGR